MIRARRHRRLAAAVVCAVVAILFALFAADVAAWRSRVARDDLRFRALPTHRGLWLSPARLPGDPAGTVLGVPGTIAWRRAVQLFWYSRIGSDPETRLDPPTLRAEAQDRLLAEIGGAPTAGQRSAAANLLGVLVVTTPSAHDAGTIEQILKRSAGFFRQAIEIDPGNAQAKENLEIVLRITRPGNGHLGHDARSAYGLGRGHAARPVGTGY